MRGAGRNIILLSLSLFLLLYPSLSVALPALSHAEVQRGPHIHTVPHSSQLSSHFSWRSDCNLGGFWSFPVSLLVNANIYLGPFIPLILLRTPYSTVCSTSHCTSPSLELSHFACVVRSCTAWWWPVFVLCAACIVIAR